MINKKFNFYLPVFALIFCAGLFLRLKLYCTNLSLHCDEANLALNLITRSGFELFKPLERLQVAPPLFLVVSKMIYQFAFFNFIPRISDMLLRLFPLICGITAIPAFGYLLQKLFNNKFITASGMLLLSFAPSAVLYSCVFKQYSTELLITIVTLIIFLKIDLENIKYRYFIFLGIMPYFSLSSFFVLSGGFCYLLGKSIKNKTSKNFLCGTGIFMLLIILYAFVFLIPVYSAHFKDMADYWNKTFLAASGLFDYIKVLLFYLFRNNVNFLCPYVIFSLILMYRTKKIFCLTAIPLFITFAEVFTKHYPLDERLMLFIIPIVIIILLYPLSLIPQKFYDKKPVIQCLVLCIVAICGLCSFPPSIEKIVTKPETARDVWEYLDKTYDNKTPVALGYSLNTNVYYKIFYFNRFKYCNFVFINNMEETLKNLPKGEYYIIISRFELYKNLSGKDFFEYLDNAKNIIVLESKRFIPDYIKGFTEENSGLLVKIRKCS